MRPVYVAGTGRYLPGAPIPVEEIDRVLGPLDDASAPIRRWMVQLAPVMRELLAIRRVHYAIDPVTRAQTDDNVTMATKAARTALEHAGLDASDVQLLCYGSAHQDQMPTASVRIQEALGIERCAELSIHANCTSAYKAIFLAWHLLRTGVYDTALVASASVASSELRAEYFNQKLVDKESIFLRWFLSDGAGALVLTTDPARSRGLAIEHAYFESIGGKRPSLMWNQRPAYWMNPRDEFEGGLHHLRQRFRDELASSSFQEEGGSVFLHGLSRMLAQAQIDPRTIRRFQVNLPARHVVASVVDECEAIGVARGALYSKLDEEGYSGPPMPLICLDRIVREETLAPGDRIVSFVTEVSKFMQAGYAAVHD